MNDIKNAIEMLKYHIEISNQVYDGFSDDDCKLAELAIFALQQQLTNRWIPTSEQFPSNTGSYIVTTTFGSVFMAVYHADKERFSSEYFRSLDVAAWRELPEPYKEA